MAGINCHKSLGVPEKSLMEKGLRDWPLNLVIKEVVLSKESGGEDYYYV